MTEELGQFSVRGFQRFLDALQRLGGRRRVRGSRVLVCGKIDFERARRHLQGVPVTQVSFVDSVPVDKDAVGATQVHDLRVPFLIIDLGVLPGYRLFIETNRSVFITADDRFLKGKYTERSAFPGTRYLPQPQGLLHLKGQDLFHVHPNRVIVFGHLFRRLVGPRGENVSHLDLSCDVARLG